MVASLLQASELVSDPEDRAADFDRPRLLVPVEAQAGEADGQGEAPAVAGVVFKKVVTSCKVAAGS
jgi:hypothetical protein